MQDLHLMPCFCFLFYGPLLTPLEVVLKSFQQVQSRVGAGYRLCRRKEWFKEA
jgi:hypothetical protein